MRRTFVALAAAAALWQALAAAPASARETCVRRPRRCSTPPRPAAKAQSEPAIAAARRLDAGERVVVPIVYHVVYGSYGTWPGEEPDDLEHAPPLVLTARQTEALNRAFRGTRLSFVTAEAVLQDFAPWSDPRRRGGVPSNEELTAMVHDLTADRTDALHVFLMRLAENRAALAETKSMFEGVSDNDGIIMDWDYLPYDGTLHPVGDRTIRRYYFEGEMLVHLVGHWLGLLHTFESAAGLCSEGTSCAQTTDFVRDTPAHRWIWDDVGHCIPLDTCKSSPGMDPMTNYMNLEPDLCASEFTPGQIERIEKMVRYYRPDLIVPAAAGAQ